ncbi:restriction endonuclease subunit S [Vibrio sp. J383]|uniref:restriction endonuclease subunit S n=1 Tax=Vibrio sp. J383 TaxID=2942997 RepID=UPI0020BEF9A0|nr:restriction endonuclease subunit S [Vibrio sp. J383]UQV21731.1 restriction endonuclease subunit S [Vibrio sp. J383]UQV22656.1 restriction endonuclease subunit S [Vibrio sp. J383]
MVPNGWRVLSLSEITKEKISYGIVQAGPHVDDGVPYIKSADVGGEIDTQKLQKTAAEIHHKYRRSAVHPNDIVFSLRGNIARTSIVPLDLPEANLTQGTARISVDEKNDTKFVYYKLACTPIMNRINSLSKGSTFKEISLEELRKVKLPLPPLPEQRKIANILTTWDKAIATTEKLIDTSKQQKKALMQQLLTGKKRLVKSNASRSVREGFALSKIGDIPDDWEVELISKHYWYQEGPGVRKHQFTENGVKLFNGTNIQQSRIDISNTSTYISSEEAYGAYSHFLADSGDLVIACSGISVERFDEKIAFIKEAHLPLCMNTSTMRFKVKSETRACLTFMRYFMMSDLFKNQIRRQITGSAQLNFGPSHIAKCFVPLPSLDEQKKIASVLSCVDKEVDILEAKLSHIKQEKKALMQQLLTGKRRVKVAETEEA